MQPDEADVFIDDITVKGPFSQYNNEPIDGNPNICQFVYKFATTLHMLFQHFIEAGVTASGLKLVLAMPRLHIVGSVVSQEGWQLEHGLVNKILKWPYCTNISEVQGFLGAAGVG
ncbi:hypothetical protein WOLCODRAFT_84590 [Wolfiporia cocos MD-104 SS10]|uniref:Uncharacterized protein n=1 Tax=Wolfiporia cocos (strain MD-104) TaxID=742152 RepID=A0A2H3JA97_WOLCO|nr:hypothetical protein WOLCODRAFT_84590 [Wolfiporia cocos MD-104 SS10]